MNNKYKQLQSNVLNKERLFHVEQIMKLNTERKLIEEQANENLRRLTLLYDIFKHTTAQMEIDDLLKIIARILHNSLNVNGMAIYLIDDKNKNIKLHASINFSEESMEKINKLQMEEESPPSKDLIRYPLRVGKEILGLVAIANKNNKPIDIKEQELLLAVCGHISTTLHNVKLFNSLNNELAERKKNEEELSKLKRAVENSPVSVLITDTNGNINYVNPWFSQVTGYSFEEVLGKNPRILRSGNHHINYYNILWNTITKGNIWHGEFLNKKKNGELYWEQASISPVFDGSGNIINYVAIKDDITEHKRIDTELRKAKEEAERANATKSTFLANMSHEIRTPMNAILGFSQLLLRDSNITAQQREHIGIINKSGEHLLDLINDILEISKIEAGRVYINLTSFSLSEFIEDLANLFRPRMEEKGLEFFIENEANNFKYIIADQNKLRQIFINLIGNALKFTNSGSIVWRINTVKKQGVFNLMSEIEDSGEGMAPEELQRLFKAFEQTEVGIKAGGTGLGLAISQKFAKIMNGEINAISTKGKGSCFKLQLEVKEGYKSMGDEKKSDNRVVGIENIGEENRVLIVDDIMENRSLLSETLKTAGFEVFEAENGKEAIEQFQKIRPNIIFMDILMPVMNGVEATKIIKGSEKGKATPIIAVTSSVFENEKNKIINSGVSGYLARPFKEKQLFEVIAACIDIKYIYENEKLVITVNKHKFDTELMKKLSSELVGKMKEATINGDSDKLFELIDEVFQLTPEIGAELKELANNYKYDELLILFK
ncbi:MAG: PAS domain S-box protein [Clostridiaceae bacterium]|nr:PAS domain S-box protein [Clostridiaceae bacterium]